MIVGLNTISRTCWGKIKEKEQEGEGGWGLLCHACIWYYDA